MYSSTHSLTSGLDVGEWSASRPVRFIPRKGAPCTHWIGGWVGPRAVLDAVVKRKVSSPHWESNPRTPIVQPAAQRYTDWAVTALANWSSSCNIKIRYVNLVCKFIVYLSRYLTLQKREMTRGRPSLVSFLVCSSLADYVVWCHHLQSSALSLGPMTCVLKLIPFRTAEDVPTTAVCKVSGLAAVRGCYAEGGSVCYAKL
jgi:hypothetical protein